MQQQLMWEDGTFNVSTEPNSRDSVSVDLSSGAAVKATRSGKAVRTIQDVLLVEGLLAAKIAAACESLDQLKSKITANLNQNSLETRARYTNSILRWFFPDGFDGIVRKAWVAYEDEKVELDLLRYLYLAVESVVGNCVAEALYPLENGVAIPASYFDSYLRKYFGEEPPAKTRERLKSNLMKLGFLSRSRGKIDRLSPVAPTKTAFIILLHYLFASGEPRTIEMRRLLEHPFWMLIGFKSEDEVRRLLREADAIGILGKYVVADQLEQITTRLTLDELLAGQVRL